MSRAASSSFGATDVRSYIVNARVPVFDQNTEQINLDLSSGRVKVGLTGPFLYNGGTLIGVTGSFNSNVTVGAVEISGNVTLNPNTKVGLTGPFIYGNYIGVTGAFQSGPVTISGGAVEISGNVNLNPNTLVGLTGPYVYGGYLGVTGAFQSGPMSISGGITGSVSVNNFPSSFGVTGPININGVTGVNGKLPVYDASANYAINNQSLKAQIDDGSGVFAVTEVQGNINGIGLNSISVYNYDLDVKLTSDPGVTAAIQTTVKNTVGVTGFVGVTSMPALTISANQFVGITGTALVKDISGNELLTTIEADISGGILVKGENDVGVRHPFYVNANGVQRTQVVTGHLETAMYVFSTDATVITSNSGVNWVLDPRGRRPGWYYSGTTNVSLNWYSNSISAPPTIHFNRIQSVWMIVTCDYVADLPKMRVTTVASVWEYTYSTAIVPAVYNGETYMFYYGAKAINLHPGVSPLLMTRTLISGPGANNEDVTGISIFTNDNAGTLYQAAGIYDSLNGQQFETIFSDNNDYTEQNNLMKLSYDASLNLKTVVNGLSDASGNFITSKAVNGGLVVSGNIRGLDTAAYTMGFNESLATPLFSAINCTNVRTSASTYTTALNIRPYKPIMPAGSDGNVLNNVTIASYGISATVSILDANYERIYGKDSFIAYRDSSPSSPNEICIFGVDGGGGFHALLPNGLPTVTNAVGVSTPISRLWSTKADLGMFASLAVKNLGSGSLTGVYLSVLTGQAYSN